ncbi:MAG: S24/S26 family peptidase [bacterium]|nr:S24/S26 family peptidase [bacterium]
MFDTESIENAIRKRGVFVSTTVGLSMFPMLRDRRDVIVVKPVKRRLKKYEVPLYRRNDGSYVLHRVIKLEKDGYVIIGDNCINKEYGITDKHVLGVLSGFYRNSKYIDCEKNKLYKIYYHIWCDILPVRVFLIRCVNKLKRIISGFYNKQVSQ